MPEVYSPTEQLSLYSTVTRAETGIPTASITSHLIPMSLDLQAGCKIARGSGIAQIEISLESGAVIRRKQFHTPSILPVLMFI
jgi:hypothetical protein